MSGIKTRLLAESTLAAKAMYDQQQQALGGPAPKMMSKAAMAAAAAEAAVIEVQLVGRAGGSEAPGVFWERGGFVVLNLWGSDRHVLLNAGSPHYPLRPPRRSCRPPLSTASG